MQLVSTPRVEFLRGLKDEISSLYVRGRIIIGVDGFDGSGADGLADDLAAVYRESGRDAFRASMRDFSKPRAQREQARADDAYDERTFRRVLIDPYRMGGSTGFQTAAFDVDRDTAVISEWKTAPADAVLIVDGSFLLAERLRGIWHFSIYVDARGARPDDGYLAEVSPFFTASAVVDTSDPERPRRIFSDSC